jgi:DNA-binding response OmpR family regulator
MRILIAEDDTALAGFVRQGLQGEHYSVDVVEDGEQARAMGSEFDYDLVILDLNLPKLDGVSVLRHLRLRRPSLPVLVLTQRNKVEDRVQCLDTGADDYLPKPFSFSELSARIRALLRRSHCLPSLCWWSKISSSIASNTAPNGPGAASTLPPRNSRCSNT